MWFMTKEQKQEKQVVDMICAIPLGSWKRTSNDSRHAHGKYLPGSFSTATSEGMNITLEEHHDDYSWNFNLYIDNTFAMPVEGTANSVKNQIYELYKRVKSYVGGLEQADHQRQQQKLKEQQDKDRQSAIDKLLKK